MADAHSTQTPVQSQTDEMLVFETRRGEHILVARVEVPRYSQPNTDGVRLNTDKRLSLAVARAVEKAGFPEIPGKEFKVLKSMDEPMSTLTYEANPAFDGVWDPMEDDQ